MSRRARESTHAGKCGSVGDRLVGMGPPLQVSLSLRLSIVPSTKLATKDSKFDVRSSSLIECPHQIPTTHVSGARSCYMRSVQQLLYAYSYDHDVIIHVIIMMLLFDIQLLLYYDVITMMSFCKFKDFRQDLQSSQLTFEV